MRRRFCSSASGSNRSVRALVSADPVMVHPPAPLGSANTTVRSIRRSANSWASSVKPLVETSTTVVGELPSGGGSAERAFCTSAVLIAPGVWPASNALVGETQTTRSRPTTWLKTRNLRRVSVTSSVSPMGIFACNWRSGRFISLMSRLSSTAWSERSWRSMKAGTGRRPSVVSMEQAVVAEQCCTCCIICSSSWRCVAGSVLLMIRLAACAAG